MLSVINTKRSKHNMKANVEARQQTTPEKAFLATGMTHLDVNTCHPRKSRQTNRKYIKRVQTPLIREVKMSTIMVCRRERNRSKI